MTNYQGPVFDGDGHYYEAHDAFTGASAAIVRLDYSQMVGERDFGVEPQPRIDLSL